MAYGRGYLEEEDGLDPIPRNPLPTQGQGQGPAPSGGNGFTVMDEGPSGGGGFGGGYTPGAPRPMWGGANIPGAPKFNAPKFMAPDKEALLNDPGYLARLDSGSQALDRSAAARGSLRGGAQVRAQQEYGQNFGSQEYGQAYNRGLQSYDREYQGAKDAYAPEFARWQQIAEANKQGALMGYGGDINNWLSNSQPHYAPEPDFGSLLGPELAPPGGPSGPSGYGDGGYGYGQEDEDPRRYI